MVTLAGRHAFLQILQAAGVDHMFGNPGTTELPMMDVLPDYPEMHYILTLQEGSRWLPPMATPWLQGSLAW